MLSENPNKSVNPSQEGLIAPIVSNTIGRIARLWSHASEMDEILNTSEVDMNFTNLMDSLFKKSTMPVYLDWLYVLVADEPESRKALVALLVNNWASEEDTIELFNMISALAKDVSTLTMDLQDIDPIWPKRRISEIRAELEENPQEFLKRVITSPLSNSAIQGLIQSFDQIKKLLIQFEDSWLINPLVIAHFMKLLNTMSK